MKQSIKKMILAIFVFLIMYAAYEYQKPIMTTGEALQKAKSCLNNPSSDLGIKPIEFAYRDILSTTLSIGVKKGFLNELTNRREISVTIKIKRGKEPTVRLDANSGKCIDVTGPVS